MTPSQWELLGDFVAHDVGGNLAAAATVGLLTAGWRRARKRRQQQEDNERQPDNQIRRAAPD
ncbi:hypothetical protein [Streptomyces sp. NPDC001815]|uniref:hypothetical protein n=1 Tax=Streptomyces sp. NPDC001815 TaxID=3154526 RepID=UPI003323F68B